MVNYGKSKIYKIQKIGGDSEIYIGSTTKDYLSQRMDKHRGNYKCWQRDGKHFINAFRLFDLYGIENCEIILLENVNCNSKDELRAREGFHIQNNICVNKNIAGRSRQESIKYYRDNNKENIKENMKLYYETNKETIKEKVNKYQQLNKQKIKLYRTETYICDCGCEIKRPNKIRHEKSNKHFKLLEKLEN